MDKKLIEYNEYLNDMDMKGNYFSRKAVNKWNKALKSLDLVSEYLNSEYSERNIVRKYYNKDRKRNIFNFSDECPAKLEGESSYDWIERKSYNSGYVQSEEDKCIDRLIIEELIAPFDEEEKKIANLIISGSRKIHIQKLLNISESQLQTKLKHMGEKLRPKPKVIIKLKICKKCNTEKSIIEFRTDLRNKDGYHSYCRDCENLARKISRKKGA